MDICIQTFFERPVVGDVNLPAMNTRVMWPVEKLCTCSFASTLTKAMVFQEPQS